VRPHRHRGITICWYLEKGVQRTAQCRAKGLTHIHKFRSTTKRRARGATIRSHSHTSLSLQHLWWRGQMNVVSECVDECLYLTEGKTEPCALLGRERSGISGGSVESSDVTDGLCNQFHTRWLNIASPVRAGASPVTGSSLAFLGICVLSNWEYQVFQCQETSQRTATGTARSCGSLWPAT
jgi:hypothetical protein